METDGNKSNYKSDLLVTSVAEIVNIALRAAISVVLARALGVAGRGEYALIFLIPGIFLSFTSFGLGEASATLIGRKEHSGREVAGVMNLFLVFLTVAMALVYFPLGGWILELAGKDVKQLGYWLGFSIIPLTLFWGNNASVLLGLGRVKQVGLGRVGNNALFLVVALAVSASKGALTVYTALYIFIAASALEIGYLLSYIARDAGFSFVFKKGILKKQLSFGMRFFAGTVFNQLNKRLDAYLVFFFLGNSGLGVYVVAVGLAEFLLAVPTVISRAAFSVSARSAGGNSAALFSASIRQTFYLLFIFSLLLLALLKPAIRLLYGADFLPAFLPCAILLPGIIALGLSVVLGYILMGQNMPDEVARASFLSCLFTVALDLALIPGYGVAGASIASSVSYAVGAVYLLLIYTRRFNVPVGELFVIRKEDLSFGVNLAEKMFLKRILKKNEPA